MTFNLKKITIASIILISGTAFAQTESLKQTSTTSVAFPVAASENTSAIVPSPVKVVKKVVKKKYLVKKVQRPEEINIISQNNILPEPIYIAPVPEYYSYNDIVVSPQFIKQGNGGWFRKESFNLVLNVKDLQGNHYPFENFVINDGNVFKVVQVATDLKSSSQVSLNPSQVYEPLTLKSGCQAFYIQYKLKGNSEYKIENFFSNNDGVASSVLPPNCALSTKEERDSTDYNAKNYITDISFTTPNTTSVKPFEFNMHLVKQGKDLFGNNLKAYIISKNFDRIYFPEIKPHRKGPYFGTHFSHPPLKSGLYNVILSYNLEEEAEITTLPRTVK